MNGKWAVIGITDSAYDKWNFEKQRCEVDPDWSMSHCRPQNSVNIKYGKWAVIGIATWNAGYRAKNGGYGRLQGGDNHLRRRDRLVDP